MTKCPSPTPYQQGNVPRTNAAMQNVAPIAPIKRGTHLLAAGHAAVDMVGRTGNKQTGSRGIVSRSGIALMAMFTCCSSRSLMPSRGPELGCRPMTRPPACAPA
jgi:hypothetical protein